MNATRKNFATVNEIQRRPRKVKASKEFLRPGDLVARHSSKKPAFESYKFLFNHVLDIAVSKEFAEASQVYRDNAMSEFRDLGDLLYDIEKHGEDRSARFAVINFLRYVKKYKEPAITDEIIAINNLTAEYGSLINALKNLSSK